VADHNVILDRIARSGYLTKGLVYLTLGALSANAAWSGGRASSSEDTARTAAGLPFGTVLVGLIGVGVFSYALWKATQAFFDTERKGNDFKGLVKRLAYGVSALLHLGFAWTCAKYIKVGGFGANSKGEWRIERLLVTEWGPPLLILAGVVMMIVAGVQLYSAYRHKYLEPLEMQEASSTERKVIDVSGRVGHTARGVVFLLVGCTFLRGALSHRVWFEDGIKGALTLIEASPAGEFGLLVVSLGLALYGLFLVAAARYRRISVV
jgi:Domain of Unknown Function (DUF1206)